MIFIIAVHLYWPPSIISYSRTIKLLLNDTEKQSPVIVPCSVSPEQFVKIFLQNVRQLQNGRHSESSGKL